MSVPGAGVLDRDGRRLAWRAGGAGAPLLLINGYAATGDDWDPGFVAALERHRRVVRPDNPGTGGSDLGDPAGLDVGSMADDMDALLGHLGIDAAPVVGWSMGGFIAQELAVRAPGRVPALALLATDPGGPGAVRAPDAVWARLTDHSGTARQQASRLIALLFPPETARDVDRRFGDLVAAARSGLPERTLAAQEHAISRWHAAADDRPVPGIPVLAVAGDADVVIPPGNLRALAARWPGCRTEMVPGAGHGLMAQAPELLADLIWDVAGR